MSNIHSALNNVHLSNIFHFKAYNVSIAVREQVSHIMVINVLVILALDSNKVAPSVYVKAGVASQMMEVKISV